VISFKPQVLQDFDYIYDSSMGVPPVKVPVWPYTLDYKIPHECKAGSCPTKSFQGERNLAALMNFELRDVYVEFFVSRQVFGKCR
jgi:hypothetical protein